MRFSFVSSTGFRSVSRVPVALHAVRVRSARRACFAADYMADTKVRNLLSVARSIEELFAFMQFSSTSAVRVCHSQVQIWKGS